MRAWSKIVVGGVALLMAAGCAADAPQTATAGKPLGADEVRALMTGNTLVGETRLERFQDRENKTFYIYLKPDGGLVIENFLGMTDTGTWEVTGDGLYCSAYHSTRKGMRRCYEVLPTTTGYALRDAERGTISSVFTTLPGNPRELEPIGRGG